ncbi:type II CAAX endopeptidase family protein [Bacillus pseudomycoides]|uniref:type II CAAX endopeptidase family protein n=1 Tax=Bacillus pseudomycoides TaxID=64104 RepID=UPI0002F84039|nr:type II CAAX endopeptidase family protein [Bacillus pseudomycoides]MED1599649.1 type II CAAX endopeptidase family protein [Bacillus pseudomycoides]MED4714446.1 type II CAAX endopeptidase family protein [Bacillus pseudomycoides]PDY09366.1 CPBP family intramembrane metalloprotease [Bacillus pseudomycoides]PEU24745.1 CPBP family intramembrane metalloprotease [Bacillus pseudomycoides]PFY00562.1 CPBP family intramembrane metalloprotease [Bacillus pseudomycoides]
MNGDKKLKKPVVSFILLTNIIFWPLFLLVGVIKLLNFPVWIFDVMLCISAWSSTFAFVLLFKKLYPEQSFIRFLKARFKNKLSFPIVLTVSMIQIIIFLTMLFLVSINSEANSIFNRTTWGVLIYYFIKTIVSGPLGEELGWRGFALMELQKKYSPLKSSIIIGFWWGMWHLPIWFTTGFTGSNLIKYILFFMITIISTTIVMTTFYNLNRNLIIPMIIHFFFNFFIGIINGQLIELIMYNAIFYLIVAVLIIVINPKKVLYGNETTKFVNGDRDLI